MSVFDRVKDLCDLKGISVSQMEKEIGISQGAAYKWKKSSPSQKMFEKLSVFFNVSIDYLMTGEEKEKREIPNIDWSTEHGLLIEMYSKINKEQKAAVFNLIRSMLSEN